MYVQHLSPEFHVHGDKGCHLGCIHAKVKKIQTLSPDTRVNVFVVDFTLDSSHPISVTMDKLQKLGKHSVNSTG